MNKDLTELVFICDRSGSMQARIDDVIGGFNDLIAKQKKEPGQANVTVAIFDDVHEVIANGTDINLIAPLTREVYSARGSTALFDAIAKTIHLVGDRLRRTPENQRPSKVLVTVMTDGMENASVEYNQQHGGALKVKSIIDHQKEKYAWQVIFIGANMDAVLVGGELGINVGQALTWNANSHAGVRGAYAVMNSYVSATRSAPSAAAAQSLCFSNEDRQTTMASDTDPISTLLSIIPPTSTGTPAKP